MKIFYRQVVNGVPQWALMSEGERYLRPRVDNDVVYIDKGLIGSPLVEQQGPSDWIISYNGEAILKIDQNQIEMTDVTIKNTLKFGAYTMIIYPDGSWEVS